MEIELFVELVIPDNTAYTALQTLQQMNFKIDDVKRYDYYKIKSQKYLPQDFKDADVLINANKHKVHSKMPSSVIKDTQYFYVLVKNREKNTELLKVLKERLGYDELIDIECGTLWGLAIKGPSKEGEYLAKKAAEQLLANRHYQEYKVL